jgi:hypothetical protein
MPRPNVFALRESGLGPFLFAEVGTDLNGSALTILTVLARLGEDPWAEAARWARLPKDAIVELLTQCISQMPLCPQSLAEARATATRLIPLLPGQQQPRSAGGTGAVAGSLAQGTLSQGPLGQGKGGPMIVIYVALVLGLAFNLLLMMEQRASAPAAAPVTAPLSAPVPPAAGSATR